MLNTLHISGHLSSGAIRRKATMPLLPLPAPAPAAYSPRLRFFFSRSWSLVTTSRPAPNWLLKSCGKPASQASMVCDHTHLKSGPCTRGSAPSHTPTGPHLLSRTCVHQPPARLADLVLPLCDVQGRQVAPEPGMHFPANLVHISLPTLLHSVLPHHLIQVQLLQQKGGKRGHGAKLVALGWRRVSGTTLPPLPNSLPLSPMAHTENPCQTALPCPKPAAKPAR